MMPLLIVGDSLLDRDLDGDAGRLAPDAPVAVVDDAAELVRPGGAALAAALAARDGRPTCLVTALGDDPAGRRVAVMLTAAGVVVMDVGADGRTGEKVRIRAGGHPLVRLDYGGNHDRVGAPDDDVIAEIGSAPAILVSDYGRGLTVHPAVRAALHGAVASGGRIVWDPHPRGATPVAGTRVVTPNLAEARRAADVPSGRSHALPDVIALAATLRQRWETAGLAVTLGRRGAVLVGADGTPLMVPARALDGPVDTCGAGDRFAASVAGAIADGAVLSEAVVAGVETASAFVAAGGAGARDAWTTPTAPPPSHDGTEGDGDALVATARARGGTVVATGGCFDLLHAGHVRLLSEARALGDCLVVCLNSDASVSRLKGAGRPVMTAADRRATLLALSAVDAVVVFDEDTPEQALRRLRPDIWVKGADYAVADLPEAPLVASWGGRTVVLPYLEGRSTTTMIQEAVRHARQ